MIDDPGVFPVQFYGEQIRFVGARGRNVRLEYDEMLAMTDAGTERRDATLPDDDSPARVYHRHRLSSRKRGAPVVHEHFVHSKRSSPGVPVRINRR